MKMPDIIVRQERRLCKVGDEFGYFHTWEHFSQPVGASPMIGGPPAGVMSHLYGIVEFKESVRRVDPTEIKFVRDEEHEALAAFAKYEGI